MIEKFLGEIKIICTKNSFDFSLLSGNTMLSFSENFTPFDWFYSGYDDDWLQMTILIQQLRQRMNDNDRMEGGGEMRVRNELHNEFNKNRKCNEFDKLQCNPLKNRNVLGSSFFSVWSQQMPFRWHLKMDLLMSWILNSCLKHVLSQ